MKIQKPSIGRVVIVTNSQGDPRVGWVQRMTGDAAGDFDLPRKERACIEVHVAVPTAPDTLVFLHAVPHDEGGAPHTWRYPPRVDEMIEVEK